MRFLTAAAACLAALPALITPALAEEMMDAATITDFITGKAYVGSQPDTGAAVGTVVYHDDGSSTLLMPDGPEPGSYRFEDNAYCTRYKNFRENSENCFTLEPIGEGRVQAWYTDGRKALILTPTEMPSEDTN